MCHLRSYLFRPIMGWSCPWTKASLPYKRVARDLFYTSIASHAFHACEEMIHYTAAYLSKLVVSCRERTPCIYKFVGTPTTESSGQSSCMKQTRASWSIVQLPLIIGVDLASVVSTTWRPARVTCVGQAEIERKYRFLYSITTVGASWHDSWFKSLEPF